MYGLAYSGWFFSNNADGLSIYGQEKNTGSLEVTKEGADEDYIAFNAFYDNASSVSSPTLAMYGGNISVTSDGAITAVGTGQVGVGLQVGGSSVFSNGTMDASGPGGGIVCDFSSSERGELTIEGGNVSGTCTGVSDSAAQDGPGIGSINAGGCDLVVKGGTVSGTSPNGAGIGGGEGNGSSVSVGIKGGTVTGTSETGAGIGGGFGANGGTVTIEGGTVNACAGEDSSGFLSAGAAIGGGSSCTGYDVRIRGNETKVTAEAESGAGIGCGDSGASGSVSIAAPLP